MIGTSQPRHLAKIVGNGFGLPALFRMNAGVGAVGIDQCEDGAPEFFRNLHHPDCLAIALRMRRAKVPVDALLHVAALLGGDDQHFFAVKPRHAADDGSVVAKAAIAVNLAEIGKHALDVIERLRALRMPRQFGPLPGGRGALISRRRVSMRSCKFGDLTARRIVGAGRFQFRDLTLDLLQLLLRFFGGGHVIDL